MQHNKWLVVTAVIAFLGVAYAGGGLSMRMTDDAAFCGSCHVMYEAVRTHQGSIHAKVACNDCHIPHDNLVNKMVYKSRSGMRDMYQNTLGSIADVIEAEPKTRDVVHQNCIRCHAMTVLNTGMAAKAYCTDCHRQVPHFQKTPVAQRRVAHE